MIRLVAVLILLASIGCTTQRATTFEHLDECVNPALESMAWRLVQGRVEEVMSVRTFRLRTDKGEVVDVSVANVGEPFDAGALAVLRKGILGTHVSVFISSSAELHNGMAAEVHDRKDRDLANYLLRKGMASFRREAGYTLTGYSECVNRIAEREAKAEGVGIWHH